MTATLDEYLKYLNLARQYPTHFIPLIQHQLSLFQNQKQMSLTEGILYETNEGRNTWLEAKQFLQQQKPLLPLVKNPGLCQAAFDHQRDLCRNGIFGHRGTDGSSFSQRILRYCKKGAGAMAQIIGADFVLEGRNTPEMTILGLIIDDGVRDRGHRKTIFSQVYKYVGWSSGKQQEKYVTNNLEPYSGSHTGIQSTTSTHSNNAQKSPRYSSNSWQPVKDITNNFQASFSSNQHPGSSTTPNFSKSEWKTQQFGSTLGSNSSSGSGSDFSKFGNRKGKKVTQKRQNTRTFYEDGAKIMETTTKFIYNDGSMEENIDRRTIYTQ